MRRLREVKLSEELLPLKQDPLPGLQILAAGLADGRTTECLTELLQGSDSDLRNYAARAFAFFRDPAALPALRQACGDRDVDIRQAARLSLLRIERESASSPGQ